MAATVTLAGAVTTGTDLLPQPAQYPSDDNHHKRRDNPDDQQAPVTGRRKTSWRRWTADDPRRALIG